MRFKSGGKAPPSRVPAARGYVILAPHRMITVPAWLLWTLGAAIAVAAVAVLLKQRS